MHHHCYLELTDEHGKKSRVKLRRQNVKLGRSPDADITLEHEGVSREHVEFFVDDDGNWHVRDLGSRNGTMVRGQPVDETNLAAGDVVVVGPFRLCLRDDAAEVTHSSLFLRLKADQTQGREIAWQEFHDRYAPIIAGYARRHRARGDEVDDIVQEVIGGFYAVSPRFVYDPAKGRFRGYLKTATIHAIRDGIRRNRVRGLQLDDFEQRVAADESAWEDIWDREILARAMADVRARYHNNKTFRAFELFAVLGAEAQAVAERLGMRVDSVYQAKRRITEALRQRVAELQGEEP